jgi:hypothetical protein
MTNFNWIELEKEWLGGKYKSLTEFSEKQKVPYYLVSKKKWLKKNEKIMKNIETKVTEITAKDQAKVRCKLLNGMNDLIDKSNETIKEGLMLTSDGEYDAYKGAVGLKIASDIYKAIFVIEKADNNIQVVFTNLIPTSYEVRDGNKNKLETTGKTD